MKLSQFEERQKHLEKLLRRNHFVTKEEIKAIQRINSLYLDLTKLLRGTSSMKSSKRQGIF